MLDDAVLELADYQPPSRGCELKSLNMRMLGHEIAQPPSRGCELKFEAPFIPVLR